MASPSRQVSHRGSRPAPPLRRVPHVRRPAPSARSAGAARPASTTWALLTVQGLAVQRLACELRPRRTGRQRGWVQRRDTARLGRREDPERAASRGGRLTDPLRPQPESTTRREAPGDMVRPGSGGMPSRAGTGVQPVGPEPEGLAPEMGWGSGRTPLPGWEGGGRVLDEPTWVGGGGRLVEATSSEVEMRLRVLETTPRGPAIDRRVLTRVGGWSGVLGTRPRWLRCRSAGHPPGFGWGARSAGWGQDLRLVTSSVAVGRTLWRSPTTPKSTSSKMGASGSLLIATMVFEVCMPARCWMAPEMPAAT